MSVSLNQHQLKELKTTLKKSDLDYKKRRRLVWRIGRAVITLVKRNIKNQKNVDGSSYKERSREKKKQLKMLRGLPKYLRIKQFSDDSVKLFFVKYYKRSNKEDDLISTGVVAKIQQDGLSTNISKDSFKNQINSNEIGTITKTQVKRLREFGYEVLINNKRKKATRKWLQENLSRAQAGVIISKMSKKVPKSNWQIKIPAREFLGINDDDFSTALIRELKNIGFGFDVKAQDIKKRGNK